MAKLSICIGRKTRQPFETHFQIITQIFLGALIKVPTVALRNTSVQAHPHDIAVVVSVVTVPGSSQYHMQRSMSVNTRNSSRSEEHTSELQSRPHLVCR